MVPGEVLFLGAVLAALAILCPLLARKQEKARMARSITTLVIAGWPYALTTGPGWIELEKSTGEAYRITLEGFQGPSCECGDWVHRRAGLGLPRLQAPAGRARRRPPGQPRLRPDRRLTDPHPPQPRNER